MDFQTTVQVTKDFMRHNPETVSAMLAALQKATDFVNNNRDESLDILSDELQIERSQLQQMMNRNMYSMVIDDRFVQGSQATGSETRYKTTAATASARPTPMA